MKIIMNKGMTQYYATTDECNVPGEPAVMEDGTIIDTSMYRGLLVNGNTIDEVLDKLSEAFKELRAIRKMREERDAEYKNKGGNSDGW